MSRIRSIHPGLWTDERFVSIQPISRLLFMGIWNECDDQGIFEWSPIKLKMRLLPADNIDAAELLEEIEREGMVLRYIVGGKSYGVVRNFTKYQRPKKPNAVHPSSPQGIAFAAGNSEPVPHQLPTEGEILPQRKEEGGEKEEAPLSPPDGGRDKRGSKIPEDWAPPAVAALPDEIRALAEQWTSASYRTEAVAFVSYWLGESGAKARKSDWNRAWYNRISQIHSKVMRDQKFGNAAPSAHAKPSSPTNWDEMADLAEKTGRADVAATFRAKKAQSIGSIVQSIGLAQ